MVINKDHLILYEQYNLNIPEQTLIKLEDGIRKNEEMLLTIAASHYGFRNGNWTVYRHDTVKDDIYSYIAPSPKPIIQQHKPKVSKVFGHVIAADYKLTDYYNIFSQEYDIEDLTTEEYIKLIDDIILPYQKQNRTFDGLAYLEVVGKLTDRQGIDKVLKGEFKSVSIGAIPRTLVCSECGRDQISEGMCIHYGKKENNTFMLAESLDYKELSFVNKPADPFGKVIRIHDGIEEIDEFEEETKIALIDTIPLKQFFELTDGKTIICVDNICTIVNREETVMKNTIGYLQEFGEEVVNAKLAELGEDVKLEDSDLGELIDRRFAIVQKNDEGVTSRRFPLDNETNVKLAMHFLCDAENLTPAEIDKATKSITKAAEKFKLDLDIRVQDSKSEEEQGSADSGTEEPDTIKELADKLVEELKSLGDIKVEDYSDDKPSPISTVFSVLKSFAQEVQWAGAMLEGSINSYLIEQGKEAVDKSFKDSLEETEESIKELEEEIQMLTDQNVDLNKQLRQAFVEEILAHKKALNILTDEETVENTKYTKVPYESLRVILDDYRAMRYKLSDNEQVNNNTQLQKINDPTQITDSAGETQEEEENKNKTSKVSSKDAIEIINNLKFGGF